jgi:GTP cyclohydrolase II
MPTLAIEAAEERRASTVAGAHTELVEVARAELPTRAGPFSIAAFARRAGDELQHIALVRGNVRGASDVPVRLHSECLTGDALGSLRCDCRDQLEMALAELARAERGVLLYLRQEGRGIGLVNKIRAYALQELGLDTFEANRHLGFDDDLRDYDEAAAMLRCLGASSVVVYTNNPKKLDGLARHGVRVSARAPLVSRPTVHNERYLRAKRIKKGHLLELDTLLGP